jgi:hypothetical protein
MSCGATSRACALTLLWTAALALLDAGFIGSVHAANLAAHPAVDIQ